jgi:hypothetical protein
MNKQFIIPSAICGLTGLLILIYKGPAWVWLRYYGGDVVSVAFLYFCISLFWQPPALWRAGLVAIIAGVIELAQLWQITPTGGSPVLQVVLGSTADPWDLLAYLLGLILAVGIDQRWLSAAMRPS